MAGVCAVSTPIDLASCATALGKPENFIYKQRFLNRLKEKHPSGGIAQAPAIYTLEHLPKIRTIYEFDDYYTAQFFGFGTAAEYYRTQSSNQFLDKIRVPTLAGDRQGRSVGSIQGLSITLRSQAIPHLRLVAADHGGHIGFISRRNPRFWLDGLVIDWLLELSNKKPAPHVALVSAS